MFVKRQDTSVSSRQLHPERLICTEREEGRERKRESGQLLTLLLDTPPLTSGFGFPWYKEQINSSDLALNSAYEMNPLSSGVTRDWRISASSALSCRFSSADNRIWGIGHAQRTRQQVAHVVRQMATRLYASIFHQQYSKHN